MYMTLIVLLFLYLNFLLFPRGSLIRRSFAQFPHRDYRAQFVVGTLKTYLLVQTFSTSRLDRRTDGLTEADKQQIQVAPLFPTYSKKKVIAHDHVNSEEEVAKSTLTNKNFS